MDLADLDQRALLLQVNAIEKSTTMGYSTGARDYVSFCLSHQLPLDPTPLTMSRYIAYTSQFIGSAPKYLTGVRHFLSDIYPDFDVNRAHPAIVAIFMYQPGGSYPRACKGDFAGGAGLLGPKILMDGSAEWSTVSRVCPDRMAGGAGGCGSGGRGGRMLVLAVARGEPNFWARKKRDTNGGIFCDLLAPFAGGGEGAAGWMQLGYFG
ncbi:hypothetical protein BDN70DRAFT_985587 [Pholiota conissans]|uniref:Uncharacterized protein n=1 Tax=Pholiota conissans TaxID=109636 RepID=A0A9P6CQL5_9AGAR|nr:hypothetical protein BDN70DRAFT_985587 [Pholiota conissans]